jgi:hypothetical protein
MATERQIAANRRNARKSTGPRSAAGKKRARRNSYRHGLAASVPANADDVSRVERLARQIAGDSKDFLVLGHAGAAAQAEFDLARIRQVKVALIQRVLAVGSLDGPQFPKPGTNITQFVRLFLNGSFPSPENSDATLQDQELDAGQHLEEAAVASITTCEQQGIEQAWHAVLQAWHAVLKDRAVVAAGLVAERTGNKTLADAGLADDQQVLMTSDPVAGGELGEQRLVEGARRFQIDILDDGRLAQPCKLEAGSPPLVLALDGFAVDHEAEPFFEVQRGEFVLSPLFFQRFGHASESERDQSFVGGVSFHSFLAP